MGAFALRFSGTVWRFAAILTGLILVIIVGKQAGSWLAGLIDIELTPRTEPTIHLLIMVSVAAYALLVAIPFVPGIEIAVGILMVAGTGIMPLLYAVTLIGLMFSFLVGYWMPLAKLRIIARALRLHRVDELICKADGLDRDTKLALLVERAPNRIVPFLLRHRYLTVALLLNVPGNMVLGGGGGIAFLAGLSKLYAPLPFFLTLLLGAAPLPVAVLLFGSAVPLL